MTGPGHGYCAMCEKHDYLLPLHGDRGGPMCCLLCIGKWDAEHLPRRRARRVLIRAIKAYEAVGGSLYGKEFDEIRLFAGGAFGLGVPSDDFKDLTRELLTATLALTHPDKHPPERRAEAQRVTQELTTLKPFVFPAPEPEPEPPPKPQRKRKEPEERDGSLRRLFDYPCEDCRETVPLYYCDACRAEYEKRQQAEFERRTAKQRAQYASRRKRILARRPPAICPICLKEFTSKRCDACFCSDRCRQQAHRKVSVTHKNNLHCDASSNRDSWRRAILALLDRHGAIYFNDLLPKGRTRAQYQRLWRIVSALEAAEEIDIWNYLSRFGCPGHKVLAKRGHTIKDREVALLHDSERLTATSRATIGACDPKTDRQEVCS